MIPFGDVVAKIGAVDPEQTLGISAKLGAITGTIFIETVVNVAEAHCPGFGVKV